MQGNEMDMGKMVLLRGQDIAQACWNFAQERNRIPEEIANSRSSYTGIILVEFPPGGVSGSLEDVKFAVRPKEEQPE
jgi:hypothetical protein